MQEFLKSISSNEEINQQLSGYFQLVKCKNDILSKKNISDHEKCELLELQKSLNEIEAILNNKNSVQEKLSQFEEFLKNRWERIRQTFLAYPYTANSPLAQFCYGIAKLLKLNSGKSDACAYQYLMPTLQSTSYAFMADHKGGFLDDLPLGSFDLDADDAYVIPLEMLAHNIGNADVPGYFIWKKRMIGILKKLLFYLMDIKKCRSMTVS
jgi:hypothetical protein